MHAERTCDCGKPATITAYDRAWCDLHAPYIIARGPGMADFLRLSQVFARGERAADIIREERDGDD